MGDIKPIETYYNGYRFRSRLEARWAVFFDVMKIEYQYEPQGYKFHGMNDEEFYYLPDFYLPKEKCYVEVKGTDEQLYKDAKKIVNAVDWDNTPCSEGLLILGDIPNPENIGFGNIPMFSFLWNNKGVEHSYAAFVSSNTRSALIIGGHRIVDFLFSYDDGDSVDSVDEKLPDETSTKCQWTYESLCSYDFSKISNLKTAYTKARQARFEHGETPII